MKKTKKIKSGYAEYKKAKSKLTRLQSLWIRAFSDCELHKYAKIRNVPLPFRCCGTLQCCHILPKGEYRNIEYDEKNLFCGCSGSNDWERKHRLKWQYIWPLVWPERVEYLQLASKISKRMPTTEIKKLIFYYKRLV